MFKVMKDKYLDSTITYFLFGLERLTRCDEILAWLVRQNLVGQRFLDFTKNEDLTVLTLARHALKKIDLDLNEKAINYGRDWNP